MHFDVENLFFIDHVPPDTDLRYDTDVGPIIRPMPTGISLACGSWGLIEARAAVVAAIVASAAKQRPLARFTYITALQALWVVDLVLAAVLIHPDFERLLGQDNDPMVKTFAHADVPYGTIYGLAEPSYVGVIGIQGEMPHVAVINPKGIIHGSFRLRSSVTNLHAYDGRSD